MHACTPTARCAVCAGVPLRYDLPDVDIYAAADGQAVLGAELPECDGSQLDGVCGFNTLMDASRVCTRRADCKGVNVFWAGESGCLAAARTDPRDELEGPAAPSR